MGSSEMPETKERAWTEQIDSSELVIYPHGATIVSWNITGKDFLFSSSLECLMEVSPFAEDLFHFS